MRGLQSRSRLLLGLVVGLALSISAASPTNLFVRSAQAAVPTVTMTLKASPNPAALLTSVLLTGTIAPSSGIPRDVRVHMEMTPGGFDGGTCQPASNCTISSFRPHWVFPSLTGKVTVTFETPAKPGRTVRFYLDSDGVGCTGTCPPSVVLGIPNVTVRATYTAGTSVIAGTTLHITVAASSNASPIEGVLVVGIPSGVDPPTNLPPGAVYSPPPSSQVEKVVTLAPTSQYSFDVVVNAANGSTLTFFPYFSATHSGPTVDAQNLVIKVGPDTTRPTTSAPTKSLVSGTAMSGSRVPVRLTWTGADAFSGVERFELIQRTDSGAWSSPVALTTTAVYRYLTPGHSYRFAVRAIDHAGNIGAYAYGSTFRLTSYSESNAANRYSGRWTLVSHAAYLGGKARASSSAGAQLTRTFTGSSIAWLSLRAATRGKARVYINGSLVATIDLYASTTQPRRLVFTRSWSTSATRTIVIRVLGTTGRPRVDIDGLLVLR
jgi:hypothetical protein